MVRRIWVCALALGLVLSFAGCALVNPVQLISGNGEITDTHIPISERFDRVVSLGSFDVILSTEASDTILFQVDENILPYLELDVYVSGTTLYLSVQNVTHMTSPTLFQFHVGVADLAAVRLAGSGSIRSDGVFRTDTFEAVVTGSGDIRLSVDIADEIDASVSGSGDILLSGSADRVNVVVAGSGTADLRNVSAGSAVASVAGSGVAIVYATGSVQATVTGSGNVIYHGDPPNVNTSVTGSGNVRRG